MTKSRIDEAIEMIQRGDEWSGNSLLDEILEQEPTDEVVWLKAAEIQEGNESKKVFYLEKALKINPSNQETMEEIIIIRSLKGPRHIKYCEKIGKELKELGLTHFLSRYDSAVSNNENIELYMVYEDKYWGSAYDGVGYMIIKESHFLYENGKLVIEHVNTWTPN
jgi:hypothetical protein